MSDKNTPAKKSKCTGCGTNEKVKNKWIYRLDDDRPAGCVRISKPYCDECYSKLQAYED